MNPLKIIHNFGNLIKCHSRRDLSCIALGVFLATTILSTERLLAHTRCLNQIKSTDSLILADPEGHPILAKNASAPRIPASTLKLLTSLAAIHELGLDYRFKTAFYTDKQHNLIVKGYGDPLLISEVLEKIAQRIPGKIPFVNSIVLDNSYFSRSISIPGRGHSTNPYDAPPSALSANFSTIKIARDKEGSVISDEPQTPLTPLAKKIGSKIDAGRGRFIIGDDPDLAARYAGELICEFLIKAGVAVHGSIKLGSVPEDAKLLFVYHSPFTLNQVIQKMLEYSNNFIAHQLLLTMGAERFAPPGTLNKGLEVLRKFAREELGLRHATIVEGSGISRKNRISAQGMLRVLMRFRPHHELMRRKGNLYYKTGTLKEVRTCAGYIEDGEDKLHPFAIFINRPLPNLDSIIQCIKESIVPRKRANRVTEIEN